MPIPLPNLDDRRWKDLVEEGRSMIPAWAPEWTDHNPTDPGITLIELFAYLSEMLLYRVNRISEDNVRAFLRLIEGPSLRYSRNLDERARDAIRDLQTIKRAVTPADYEALAIRAGAGRAHCIPERDFSTGHATAYMREAPGHISVVICPRENESETDELLDHVQTALERTRILTARVHVCFPGYVEFGVRVTVEPKSDANRTSLHGEINKALKDFFDPYRGGPARTGWPLGRSVYVSEIYQVLEGVEGVESVHRSTSSETRAPLAEIALRPDLSGRLRYNRLRELEAVELQANELPKLNLGESDITL